MENHNLEHLISKRISTRAFLDKEVSDEQLLKLVELASRAPSWKNAQSYKVCFIKGNPKNELVKALSAAVESRQEPRPNYEYEKRHPPYIKKRMFNLGMSLYEHMGIGRKDKEAREEHFMKNYTSFGAPVIAFFYIPTGLAEWSILDLGLFMGYLSLVAEDMGLATCFQASLAVYPDIVDSYVKPPEKMKMILGMALGYATPDDRNNSFQSTRAPLDEVLQIVS